MRSFAQAQHVILKSDADFGRFVDASIVGSARQRAITLLRLMPARMRGDFVEIHKDGSVTSNRADLPAMVKFKPSPAKARVAPRSPVRAAAASVAPAAWPPTGGSGGPYIRLYSYQGINAAYGVATPPCDATLTAAHRDSGNMYFNAYDPNGSDQTDAGIGADEYPGHDPVPVTNVYSYVNRNGDWDPHEVSGTFVNAYENWGCGRPLVIVYGTLPSPNNGTSMLAVGPPDYDPGQFSLPPSTVTLQNPAWTFFNTPGGLNSGPGSYQGIPSNCMGCGAAVMLGLAEPDGADGSCYGLCSSGSVGGQADATWSNVVMGELISPCGPKSFGLDDPCTLEYESSGNWYSGSDACDACDRAFGSDGTAQQITEGIADLNYNPAGFHKRLSPATVTLPAAPSTTCTPDAKKYCAIVKSSTVTAFCADDNSYKPIVLKAPTIAYYIFKKGAMFELQETAKDVPSFDDSCKLTHTWTPNNPAVHYDDSNLP